jgi:hypothetical protein
LHLGLNKIPLLEKFGSIDADDRRTTRLARALQAAEDDLVAAGKQRVTIDGLVGIFTWVRLGALGDLAELVIIAGIQAIEYLIVTQGWDDIVVATIAEPGSGGRDETAFAFAGRVCTARPAINRRDLSKPQR